jgi:hypothetical protein
MSGSGEDEDVVMQSEDEEVELPPPENRMRIQLKRDPHGIGYAFVGSQIPKPPVASEETSSAPPQEDKAPPSYGRSRSASSQCLSRKDWRSFIPKPSGLVNASIPIEESSDFPGIPYSGPFATRAELPKVQYPVIMPSYSSWFNFDEIHTNERRALPEIFEGNNAKAEALYKV